MLKRGTPRCSLAPPCPCAPDAPNEGMVNPSGIGDGKWGNGMVIGRDGAIVDIVGAALVAAAADEDEPAIVVDPNPGSP